MHALFLEDVSIAGAPMGPGAVNVNGDLRESMLTATHRLLWVARRARHEGPNSGRDSTCGHVRCKLTGRHGDPATRIDSIGYQRGDDHRGASTARVRQRGFACNRRWVESRCRAGGYGQRARLCRRRRYLPRSRTPSTTTLTAAMSGNCVSLRHLPRIPCAIHRAAGS